jgi:hypothetical protein
MEKQLIVLCVLFILPNKIQLDFHVRSRKIKPRPPASGGWSLVGSHCRRSMCTGYLAIINSYSLGEAISRARP